MRILILGLPKTGTTALYFKVLNSIEDDKFGLFEPSSFVEQQEYDGKHIVAKSLIHEIEYDSFRDFDKKILILRDPRDWEISRLLYLFSAGPYFFDREDIVIEMLRLLKKKENCPGSVPMTLLIDFIERNSSNGFSKVTTLRLNQLTDFHKMHKDEFFICTYEDIVDAKYDGIRDYLGINLTGEAEVDKLYERVVRTKGYGNWKNWFTAEDIKYYKPRFECFMNKFGYIDNWGLNEVQKIEPAHCSEYVLRVVNEKRSGANLEPISGKWEL